MTNFLPPSLKEVRKSIFIFQESWYNLVSLRPCNHGTLMTALIMSFSMLVPTIKVHSIKIIDVVSPIMCVCILCIYISVYIIVLNKISTVSSHIRSESSNDPSHKIQLENKANVWWPLHINYTLSYHSITAHYDVPG